MQKRSTGLRSICGPLRCVTCTWQPGSTACSAAPPRAAQAVRWREQQLQQACAAGPLLTLRALDSFNEPVLLVDTASGPDWRILYANPGFCDSTGISREAALASAGFWQLFEARQLKAAGPFSRSAAGGEAVGEAPAGAGAGLGAAQAAAASGRKFVVRAAPRAAACGCGAGLACSCSSPASSSGQQLLTFEFKPAGGSEQLREDMPHLGESALPLIESRELRLLPCFWVVVGKCHQWLGGRPGR